MTTASIDGTTNVGVLFFGVKAPYFGRGAVKSLKLRFDDYDGEFWLVSTGPKRGDDRVRIAKSTNQVLQASDIDAAIRQKSFENTKLPYKEYNIDAEKYINLSAYERLEIEVEDVNEKDCRGFIDQEWSQLIIDEHTPTVRFAFNLAKEVEYIPPQIRKERADKARKEAEESTQVVAH